MSISWTIETHKKIKSTQDIVKGLASIDHPEGMVICAQEQSDGQGRHGRSWISEKGNLFMSVLLRPSCTVQGIGMLSLLTGVAVARALQKYTKDKNTVSLKWPNDILLSGQKCGGILLETGLTQNRSIEWVAVGIGVNIVSAPPGLGSCLKDHAKKAPKPEALCREILNEISRYYSLWTQKGPASIRAAWLELGHKKGDAMCVKIGSQIEEGRFYDVDEQGSLLLQDSKLRLKTVTAGEVYI